MAQNITLLGANYPDVPAVTLPTTGGGTATFSDTRSVTYNLSGGATASVNPSEVVAGQGFSVKLTAPTGYVLSEVTVTMGGNNITSQVFTPDAEGGGGGGSVVVTEEANATGITCVITTSSEPTPSETWETLYDGAPTVNPDTPYNLFWISELTDVYPTAGSEWKITVDSVEYRCTATLASTSIGNTVCIGNPKYTGGQDDGSNAPFSFYNAGWGALVGDTELSAGAHMLKIERLVTS